MRGLLLDTHVFIWAVNEPTKLSASVRAALQDADKELFVSAASSWELATKHRLGKLPGAEPWISQVDRQVSRLGAQTLAITSCHAFEAGAMDWSHRDPFDRMLAAQARLESLVLVTRDRAFREVADLEVLW